MDQLNPLMDPKPTTQLSSPTLEQSQPSVDQLVQLSRERIEKGSKSFASAARLFPEATRASAYMLYAWCRHCDDEIDGQVLGYERAAPSAQTPAERLEGLRQQTLAALQGRATEPVFQALQHVVARHQIPHHHPMELLEGMEMDVVERRYRTLDDTLEYSYHVAGVVGVMMAMIMGVRDRPTLERASDLGIAFQLTNIARDIVPDAIVDRVYLPADWLAEARIPEREIADPAQRRAVFLTTERLLDVADTYYASSGAGISHLPFRSAWSISAARRVYREIGTVVRSRGVNAWDARAGTSKSRKLASVAIAGVEAAAARSLGRVTPASPRAATLWTPKRLGVS
jgi:15-cis-phytoene synthase